MANYIAFLRGINVGGKNLIKMADLTAVFESVGLSHVKTFIQSGNVLFDSKEVGIENLRYKIEDQIEKILGKKITVILRTRQEIETIIRMDPFKNQDYGSVTKLYVCFLDSKPEVTPSLPLHNEKEALVLISVTDRDAFLVSLPKEAGHFGFPNPFIEKELKVPSTARNWTTVSKIAALL